MEPRRIRDLGTGGVIAAPPGLPGWTFLAYLFLFTPWMAWRSARVLRAMRDRQLAGDAAGAGPRFPSRTSILGSTLFSLALLFVLTLTAARYEGVSLFAAARLGGREALWGALALALCLGVRSVVAASRSPEERRRLAVRAWLPRTPGERVLFAVVALAAGIAEEAAYRGLAPALLAPVVGGLWIAALLSAAAFALGHSAQGMRSMAAIFVIALVMQSLLGLTGTLLVAMIVHVLYDWIAAALTLRRMRREAAAAAAPAAAAAAVVPATLTAPGDPMP